MTRTRTWTKTTRCYAKHSKEATGPGNASENTTRVATTDKQRWLRRLPRSGQTGWITAGRLWRLARRQRRRTWLWHRKLKLSVHQRKPHVQHLLQMARRLLASRGQLLQARYSCRASQVRCTRGEAERCKLEEQGTAGASKPQALRQFHDVTSE
eukprot:102825-Rhodomonas_salina.1